MQNADRFITQCTSNLIFDANLYPQYSHRCVIFLFSSSLSSRFSSSSEFSVSSSFIIRPCWDSIWRCRLYFLANLYPQYSHMCVIFLNEQTWKSLETNSKLGICDCVLRALENWQNACRTENCCISLLSNRYHPSSSTSILGALRGVVMFRPEHPGRLTRGRNVRLGGSLLRTSPAWDKRPWMDQ